MPTQAWAWHPARPPKISFGRWRQVVFFAILLLIKTTAHAAEPTAAIDNPMFLEPALTIVPPMTVFDPRDKTLWLAALARPDADTRRQAADAIGLAASQGMPDLADAAAPIAATLDSDTRPVVRQACAQALYRLNAWHYAATLLKHDNDDWQTTLIADQALSTWNDADAFAIWWARISDPHATELSVRSALQAIGRCSIRTPDASPILAIAKDPARSPSLRLDAAQAFAKVTNGGIWLGVSDLASSHDLADRLVAATIANPSLNATAPQVLLKLADDHEPMVVAIAARRLMLFDPKLLVPLDYILVGSEDFAVRSLAVQVLTAQRSQQSVALLATMMDDPNRQIRESARDALLSLDGDPKLASAVSGGAVKIVSGDQPRGIEQALLLLGATNDHHADERIPALLVGPRPELRIAADVAVRRLRIQSALPTLAVRLGEIMTQLEQQHAAALTNSKAVMSDAEFINLGEEASQIAQALGEMDYEPAEAMLRKLVPKSPIYPGNMRPAAVWALGRLHAGTPDNRLVGELMDRATDHSIQMPESPLVQTMAVEAIGMMHATNAVAPLQKIIDTGAAPDQFTAACRWAIGQLTGHEPPPPPAQQITAHGFFLEAKH